MKKKLTRILSVYVLVLGLWFMSSPAPYVAHAAAALAEYCCTVSDGNDNVLLRCCGSNSCSAEANSCCSVSEEDGRQVKTCKTLVDE